MSVVVQLNVTDYSPVDQSTNTAINATCKLEFVYAETW